MSIFPVLSFRELKLPSPTWQSSEFIEVIYRSIDKGLLTRTKLIERQKHHQKSQPRI